MGTLFAQVAVGHAWSFGEILVAVIVIAACVGIVWVALRAMGVQLPQWFVQILLIIAVAVVAILAIKFLLTL